MPRVRRTVYFFLFCHDRGFLDVGLLLRGVTKRASLTQLYGISILAGAEYPLTPEELDALLAVPSDSWVEAEEVDPDLLDELAGKGLLLTDGDDERLAELRRRDERLAAEQWNVYAALYHFMTKWRDVDIRAPLPPDADPLGELPGLTREMIDAFVARHGTPPEAFHAVRNPLAVLELPLTLRDDGLYSVLARRKTTRRYESDVPMTTEQLALVLYYVFGCHGYARFLDDDVMLKRTSPSGGGLHPVDAYPLVSNVDGVEPGLYHYNAREHTLELLSALTADEVRLAATGFMCGQTYFGGAHVAFVLAARFYRNHWKYRKHQKAYAAMLMDVAHLSQTLYLVAADLGLGAFVTAAINTANIEERLGLDGYREGVLAILGCGRPSSERSAFDPVFEPYVPRETA